MTPRDEFVEHVLETMRAFGPVEPKAMFGGWGLYHAGLFFALIADNVLYLKVDAENRGSRHDSPAQAELKRAEGKERECGGRSHHVGRPGNIPQPELNEVRTRVRRQRQM